MKKISQRLLAAAVVAAVGVSASAEVLSPEQALGRALPQARRAAPALSQPVLAYTAEAEELPAVYVFAKENKGFLLVSADDAVTPLLGFADAGNFDADNMAPAFKYWIGEYARQIAYARENNLTGSEKPRFARSARPDIEPLVKTRWDQDEPYNLLCPKAPNGKLTYTGCVATAAAQIAKYHEFPKEYNGEIKGDCSVQGVSTELVLDLAKNPLRWDLMLDNYTAQNPGTEEQRLAVANLMIAMGYGVNMSYTTNASGAQTSLVGRVLAQLGYNKGIKYLQRDCYTLEQWENLIYEQLGKRLPVIYDGTSLSAGGHAFVCDGYKEENGEGYFHINWGWGGTSDGYFLVGALDPEMQGIGGSDSGFNYDQDITIDIYPATGDSQAIPSVTAMGNGLEITPGYFNLGREVTVTYAGGGFMNHGYENLTFTLGVHIVGEGQDFYRWAAGDPNEDVKPGTGLKGYTVLLSGVKENSTYVITPAYRVGEEVFEVGMPYGKTRAYVLKTSVHNGTLTPVSVALDAEDVNFTDANNAIVTNVKANNRIYINGKFINNTDSYYYGHAAAMILDKEYGEYKTFGMFDSFTVNVAPGESLEFRKLVRFTNGMGLQDNHDYYFCFMDPETGAVMSDLFKFHYGTVVGINDVTTEASAITLYPNPAESFFTVQGAEVNTVNVYSLAGSLAAKANQATVDVAGLAAGIYLVEVIDAEGNHTTVRLIKK